MFASYDKSFAKGIQITSIKVFILFRMSTKPDVASVSPVYEASVKNGKLCHIREWWHDQWNGHMISGGITWLSEMVTWSAGGSHDQWNSHMIRWTFLLQSWPNTYTDLHLLMFYLVRMNWQISSIGSSLSTGVSCSREAVLTAQSTQIARLSTIIIAEEQGKLHMIITWPSHDYHVIITSVRSSQEI